MSHHGFREYIAASFWPDGRAVDAMRGSQSFYLSPQVQKQLAANMGGARLYRGASDSLLVYL